MRRTRTLTRRQGPLSDVAIATMTRVGSAEEEMLMQRALAQLTQWGMPLAVADAGVSKTFAESLRKQKGVTVVVPSQPGLVGQVKTAVTAAVAFNTPFILYTEPDKEMFFKRGIGTFLQRALRRPNIGVVLASRSHRSFKTFPPMQRYTEGVINHLCTTMVGRLGDYSYGPFLMSRAAASLIQEVDAATGWGWRPFVFVAAHERALNLEHVTGEYTCPANQRGEDCDQWRHRLQQLQQNLLGLTASYGFLAGQKRNP